MQYRISYSKFFLNVLSIRIQLLWAELEEKNKLVIDHHFVTQHANVRFHDSYASLGILDTHVLVAVSIRFTNPIYYQFS